MRCQVPLKIISYLRHTWWGADPRLLKSLYTALIRSRLDCGGFISHEKTKSQQLKIDRIQYKALRLCLGLRMSTPINFILREVKEPPLLLKDQFLCMSFIIKILSQPFHPIINTLTSGDGRPWLMYLSNVFICSLLREATPPLILYCFNEASNSSYLIRTGSCPTCFDGPLSELLFCPQDKT